MSLSKGEILTIIQTYDRESRTDLSTMNVCAYLIEMNLASDDKLSEYVFQLRRATESHHARFQELMLLLNAERDATKDITIVNMVDLISEAMQPIEEKSREDHLTLSLSVETQTLPVQGNLEYLTQSFRRFLGTLHRFGRYNTLMHQTISIYLSSEKERVIIRVSLLNGIESAFIDKVFEPYYPIRKGTRHDLGLTLMKHVAELYGGSAKAEAYGENSTRLTIALPLYQA